MGFIHTHLFVLVHLCGIFGSSVTICNKLASIIKSFESLGVVRLINDENIDVGGEGVNYVVI